MNPQELTGLATPEFLDNWGRLIAKWETPRAQRTKPDWFRWTDEIDDEEAEYLLYGLGRCMRWARTDQRINMEELRKYSPVTMHIVQGFVDGLLAEGRHNEHYVDQIRASIGVGLDH